MKILNKIPNIALVVIAAISLVLIVLLVTNISADKNNATMGNWININLSWGYVLFFLALILLIGFASYQVATEFKSAKGGLVGVGAIIVIFLVAYLFASKEYPTFFGVERFIDNGTITHSIMKMINTALYSTYIMFGLAIFTLIYISVSRYFK